MPITDAMVEAAAEAIWEEFLDSSHEQTRRVARAALTAALSQDEWQDVETNPPPKDRTPVIAYWPHLKRPVIAWIDDRQRRGSGCGWVASHNTSFRSAMMIPPTHWRPLPTPPIPTQEEG